MLAWIVNLGYAASEAEAPAGPTGIEQDRYNMIRRAMHGGLAVLGVLLWQIT